MFPYIVLHDVFPRCGRGRRCCRRGVLVSCWPAAPLYCLTCPLPVRQGKALLSPWWGAPAAAPLGFSLLQPLPIGLCGAASAHCRQQQHHHAQDESLASGSVSNSISEYQQQHHQ